MLRVKKILSGVYKGVFLALLASLFPVWADMTCVSGTASEGQVIQSISFTGLERTKERVLHREIKLSVGQPFESIELERARQSILDLELFKSVTSLACETPQGVALKFAVKEKYYFYAIPRLSRNSTGDFSYGVRVRADNIAGQNQTMRVLLRRKDFSDADLAPEDRFALDYNFPGIWDSYYQLDFLGAIARQEVLMPVPGFLEPVLFTENNNELQMIIGKWLNQDSVSQGWRLGGGLVWRRRLIESHDAIDVETENVAWLVDMRHRDVHSHVYSETGHELGYRLEVGLSGTPVNSYWTQEIFYRQVRAIAEDPDHQYRFEIGFGHNSGSQIDFVSFPLNGKPEIRGVNDEIEDGREYYYLNFAYLRPLFGLRSFRGEIFAELADLYTARNSHSLSEIPAAIGGGFRWRLKSFVRFDISFGASYLPNDEGKIKAFAQTSGSF